MKLSLEKYPDDELAMFVVMVQLFDYHFCLRNARFSASSKFRLYFTKRTKSLVESHSLMPKGFLYDNLSFFLRSNDYLLTRYQIWISALSDKHMFTQNILPKTVSMTVPVYFSK